MLVLTLAVPTAMHKAKMLKIEYDSLHMSHKRYIISNQIPINLTVECRLIETCELYEPSPLNRECCQADRNQWSGYMITTALKERTIRLVIANFFCIWPTFECIKNLRRFVATYELHKEKVDTHTKKSYETVVAVELNLTRKVWNGIILRKLKDFHYEVI